MPQSSNLFESTPIEPSDACVVRAAKAVPTWQAVIPAKVIVVAARYCVCSEVPESTSAPGDQPAFNST